MRRTLLGLALISLGISGCDRADQAPPEPAAPPLAPLKLTVFD